MESLHFPLYLTHRLALANFLKTPLIK